MLCKSNDLHFPKMYCQICELMTSAVAASVPEIPNKEIYKWLKPYQYTNNEVINNVGNFWQLADNEDWTNPMWSEIKKYKALSPDDFSILAQAVRDSMGLSSKRIIYPRASVGPVRIRTSQPILYDILGGATGIIQIILTERAKCEFLNSGLSGFIINPAIMRGNFNESLYVLTVFGKAGKQILNSEAYYKTCEGCKTDYLFSPQPLYAKFDESTWDGSDFFHILDRGMVYISQRAKEWLTRGSLRLEMNLEPLEQALIYPEIKIV